jgi:hypothetical protein
MRHAYRHAPSESVCALREECSLAAGPLAATIAQTIASMALVALEVSGDPLHEPIHALKLSPLRVCYVT